MGLFSKKKQNESVPTEEPTPLSSNSLSSLKSSFEEIRNISKDPFFNASQTIGALEIDDEQDMWRSTSFNNHVAFRFNEILSVECGEETLYKTLGTSTGNITSSSIGISSGNLSGTSANGKIVQHSSAYTESTHIQVVSVYTNIAKYRNVTINASTPAEAQTIKKVLESRMPKTNTPQINRNDLQDKTPTTSKNQDSPIDEIRKYKELLDDGIITEEEFTAKKKQLLNI